MGEADPRAAAAAVLRRGRERARPRDARDERGGSFLGGVLRRGGLLVDMALSVITLELPAEYVTVPVDQAAAETVPFVGVVVAVFWESNSQRAKV